MADYTFTNLPLMAMHEPDATLEPDGSGGKTKTALPGELVIGTEIGGTFVPLVRLKAGPFADAIEQHKQGQQAQPAQPQTETQVQQTQQ